MGTEPVPSADPLLALTAQLASGQSLDWAQAQSLEPTLREQLRQIELLAGGFGIAPDEDTEAGTDAKSALTALQPGDRFGPLCIRQVLGRGSFGQVYRAYDAELDREVALKLVHGEGRSRSAILHEARLLARLDHPNVLRVYGALEDDGRIGLAFELIEGQTLEAWIGGHESLGAHALVATAMELGAALCALHQVGIVHGDLKPSNVLRHPGGR
ncbi:MAG: protein kinase, partial [Xanthomonadales bacterium]|nr:protein kinase [Xanthomonadales bacterium]